ncbi:MAG: helicase [Geobacter sp.]|nr:helicase [Geobacter sp.]
MHRYFSDQAIARMREEIEAADGNEVFFLGRTNADRIVVEVEPLARGNRDAVAAILIAVSFGDVVVHNHPSGKLTPSKPDIEIASVLGNQGVGFYIVDNRVERCYAAVGAVARKSLERLSFPEVERFFAPEGPLATGLKGYEHRGEQLRMAFAVAEAFNDDRIAVVEAGTGTGKSLAYLYPAILWATRNKERVVVSTNTINLQEQLIKKDIPLLREKGSLEFRAVLVKGRQNYLCLRKLETVKPQPSLFVEGAAEQELYAIIEWSAATSDGCATDLSFIPRRETWEEVCCEADQCGRAKCPFYGRCFFYAARREAAGADILVVNHALLMTDVAVRQETGYSATAVLPPFSRLVIDEGHHLEEMATNHLTSQISRQGLLKLFGRLQHPRRSQAGIVPRLSSRLSKEMPEELDDLYQEVSGILEMRLHPRCQTLVDLVSRNLDAIGLALLSHLKGGSGEQKLRVTPDLTATIFWTEVEEQVKEMARELGDFVAILTSFLKACERLPEKVREKLSGELVDLAGFRSRLDTVVHDLFAFIAGADGTCRWFEVKRGSKGMTVRLCCSPLEVAEAIKGSVLDAFKTVVLTSATLTVGGKFDYLERRTGLDLVEAGRALNLMLPSPFDYERQALVGIPDDLPEPTSPGFEEALAAPLLEALRISGGRAFVLFTSYDLLTRLYDKLRVSLEKAGLSPMRQGEMHRHLLLSRFKKEQRGVLFGTDSFWEGVDVPGKALELVIITRLPFRVPTEPIQQARVEHIAASGGDPFMEYTVPQAVIKLRQGFGRLIRSRVDRGGVLILDKRIVSKPYGRIFLKSLPPARRATGGWERVRGELERFFTDSLSPDG